MYYKNESRSTASPKGYIFTLEAGVSILLFMLMLSTLPQVRSESTKELALVQQANDLLRVWSAKETSEQEMVEDTKLVFGKSTELWINQKQTLIGQIKNNSISTEGILLNAQLQEQKVKITIYFD